MQKKYHTHTKKNIVNTKKCLSLQFYYFKNLFKLVLRFLSKFKPFHFKLQSANLDTIIISKFEWHFSNCITRKGPQPVRDISTPWKYKHILSYLWFCKDKHKRKSSFQNVSRNFNCFKWYRLHSFRFYIRWCVMCTWVL